MKTLPGTSWKFCLLASIVLCAGTLSFRATAGMMDGLAGYWSFDETNGLVAVDSSGLGHYGMLCGFTGDNSQWIASQLRGALWFGGATAGEHVRVTDYPKATATLSASAWVWADGPPQPSAAIVNNWGDTQAGQFEFGLLGGAGQLGVRLQPQAGSPVSVLESTPMPTGSYQHVAFVADGSFLHLYRNGAEVGTPQPYTGPIRSNANLHALVLGARLNDAGTSPASITPGLWTGMIDDVAVWTRALSAGEIQSLYRAGVSGLGLSAMPPNANIRILGITDQGGYQFKISFEDLVGDAGAYQLQSRPDLQPATGWTVVSNAQFSFSAGQFHFGTSGSATGSRFYRVAAVGDQDTDGDGLTDIEEIALGTNPLVADTDGDGYSDGLEVAGGANPLNNTNRLARAQQPEASFLEPTSTTQEGVGMYWVPVSFSQPCAGQLRYSISVMSTATNGVDFSDPQNGLLPVNGTSAAIPLTLVDDLAVENIEAIVLELHEDPVGDYHTGANPTHSVLIFDNDADWSGVLRNQSGENSFRLRLLRNGAQTSASLIPSPKSTTNHFGGQIVPPPPAGQVGWPVTNLVFTSNRFEGVSATLPMGSSRMLGGVPLTRTLAFAAVPPPTPHDTNVFYVFKTNALAGPLGLAGDYSEAIQPVTPGMGHLQFTNRGIFVLTREAAVMTPLQIPTTPAP